MRVEIGGRNPEVEEGRPINLNINLEQNLLQLRESLRYVDGLNEAIDETVQEFLPAECWFRYRGRSVKLSLYSVSVQLAMLQ